MKAALEKIIIFHFRSLRVRNGCHMTDKAIKNLLNDLADVSDISGASDNSDNNETYIPIEG